MHYRTLISVRDCLRSGLPPGWVIVDCRFDLADKGWGESACREGHIPGAHYAHLERHLSGPVRQDSGRHPLPHWGYFTEQLGLWGIQPTTQVVVYDQNNGAYAARLWWMLRALGHDAVAVLDGGLSAWLELGGDLEESMAPFRSKDFPARSGSGWVTTQQVQQNLHARDQLLVDARSVERFVGEREPIDAVAGHVPGARNRPFTDNLREDGRFLPSDLLKAQWTEFLAGWAPESVVHMCGSGVTACHNLLAMEVSGLAGSRLYVGSWSEWIRGQDRPVAVGSG